MNRELIAEAERQERHRGRFWTWTRPRFRSTASRNRAPTTHTMHPPSITRFSCSTAVATVWPQNCGQVTFAAPTIGSCASPKLHPAKKLNRRLDILTVKSRLDRPTRASWKAMKTQADGRSEEHTSELQSLRHLVCR